MDVKIAGGKFRGRKLTIPATFQDFRPTKSMVREAVCSSIQQDIPGAKVLELCAGSGVFSLELISRGAAQVTAVERSPQRVEFIRSTVDAMALALQVSVYEGGVKEFLDTLSESDVFDIIFFDPPYYDDALTELVYQVLPHLSPYGVFVFEYATDDVFAAGLEQPHGFTVRSKKYGKSTIKYYRQSEE